MGLADSGVLYLGDKHHVEPDRGDGLHNAVNALKLKVKSLSRVQLFATPWTVAYQASPSMGFSRQEYWSGLPSLVEKKKLLTTQPQPSDQG